MKVTWTLWTLGLLALSGCPKDPQSVNNNGRGQTQDVVVNKEHPEKSLRKALDLLALDSRDAAAEAAQILQLLVDDHPDKPALVHDLAAAHTAAGDLEAAATALSQLTRSQPDDPDAWISLGKVEMMLGDYASAKRHAEKAIGLDEEKMGAHVLLAEAQRLQGECSSAIETAKKALEIDTRSLELYDQMGLCYQELGDLELASFIYKKARFMVGGDEHASIIAHQGWTSYLQGGVERLKARAYLEEAIGIDPDDASIRMLMAELLLADRAYEKALPHLERATELTPRDANAQLRLGVALRGVERYEDAEAAYKKALELDPATVDAYMNLGILHADYLKRDNGANYAEAADFFDMYVKQGGSDRDTALAYIEDTEKERARADRRRKAEQERKARQEKAAEQQRLLEEARREEAEAAARGETTPEGAADDQAEGAGSDDPTAEPAAAPDSEPAPASSPDGDAGQEGGE